MVDGSEAGEFALGDGAGFRGDQVAEAIGRWLMADG